MTSPFTPQPDQPDVQRHSALACLACGQKIDAASASDGSAAVPRDGDFSVCFWCAEPAIYTVTALGVALRPMTAEEAARFNVEHSEKLAVLKEFLRSIGRLPPAPPPNS